MHNFCFKGLGIGSFANTKILQRSPALRGYLRPIEGRFATLFLPESERFSLTINLASLIFGFFLILGAKANQVCLEGLPIALLNAVNYTGLADFFDGK